VTLWKTRPVIVIGRSIGLEAPFGAVFESDSMQLLKDLKARFQRRDVARKVEKEQSWSDVVRRLADNEDVSLEEIDAVVDSANSMDGFKCPSGCKSKILAKRLPSGDTQCQCDSCAREFVEPQKVGSSGEWSADRLEKDVERLIQRRVDVAMVKELPALEKEQKALRVLRDKALAKRQKALDDYLEFNRDAERPENLVVKEINAREALKDGLRKSWELAYPAQALELLTLETQRRNLSMKSQRIREDFFGSGAMRATLEPQTGTAGDKWLQFVSKFYGYPGGPVQLHKINPMSCVPFVLTGHGTADGEWDFENWQKHFKEDDARKTFAAYRELWRLVIVPGLAEVERCKVEVEKLDARIAELLKAVFEP